MYAITLAGAVNASGVRACVLELLDREVEPVLGCPVEPLEPPERALGEQEAEFARGVWPQSGLLGERIDSRLFVQTARVHVDE